MDPKFIIERDGKKFVLYAGLLNEAHEAGLRRISTELIQAPSEANNQTAIVRAEVELEHGCFTGIGDASPTNVSRMLLPHFIRMAETRAKARALRDAVNIGMTALEELDGPTEDSFPDERQVQRSSGPPATDAQLRAIYQIAKNRWGYDDDQTIACCQEQYGKPPSELTKREASTFISFLQDFAPTP